MNKVILLAVVLALLVIPSIATASNTTAFLEMQFNETSGTNVLNEGLSGDASVGPNAFNGTILGASVTVGAPGKNATFGTAFNFSGGTGRVEIGGASSIYSDGINDWSMCLWMKPSTWSGSATPISVYGGDAPSAQDGWRLQQSGANSILFLIYQDGNNEQITHVMNGTSPVGKWTQLCLMRQDTTPSVTMNMTLIENNYDRQSNFLPGSRDTFTILSPLCVGIRCNNNDRPFDGLIDHVYFWNFTINESYVQAHYNGLDFDQQAVVIIEEVNPKFVNFTAPLNNSFNETDPINLTFLWQGIDSADMCNLSSNISGVFDVFNTLQANVTVLSTEMNISQDVLLLAHMDEGAGLTAIDSSKHGNDGVHNSGTGYAASKGGNGTGDFAASYDGVNDDTSFGSPLTLFSFSDGTTDQPFSITTWAFMNDATDFMLVTKGSTENNKEWVFGMDVTDELIVELYSGDGDNDDEGVKAISSTTMTGLEGEWVFFAMTYNGNNSGEGVTMYVNTIPQNFTVTNTGTYLGMSAGNGDLTVGEFNAENQNADGLIDEVAVWNITLNQGNITSIFTNGVRAFNETTVLSGEPIVNGTEYGLIHDLPNEFKGDLEYRLICYNDTIELNTSLVISFDVDFTPPNITLLAPPLVGNVTNVNVDINASLNEFGVCSLNNGNWSLATSNTTFFFFEDQGANSSFYNLTLTCVDTSVHNNTALLNFGVTKDVVQPLIVTTFPDEFNTTVVDNTGTIAFLTNITDDFGIFGYNYNITDLSGTLLYQQNESGVTDFTRIINPTLSTGNWTNSTLLVSVFACDSHTAKELSAKTRNAKVIKHSDELEMVIGKGKHRTEISVTSIGGGEQATNVIDKRDRKQFVFNYQPNSAHPKKYRVETNKNVHIMDSQFIGHAIIDGMGGHWIDFEGFGDDYSITVLDNGYEIEFHDITADEVIFNSIGDLNCNNEFYTFQLREVEPPLFFLDLGQTSSLLLIGILVVLYIGLTMVGMFFRNIAFCSLAFFIGIILALFLSNVHLFLTLAVFFLNVAALLGIVRTFK